MIFLDSNVPMYLVGAEHPNKSRAGELLERAIRDRETLVTDAEVFQEILHRYSAIRRIEAIPDAWTVLAQVVDVTLPVEIEDVERARDLLTVETLEISARDALHTAVMRRYEIERILTFDTGFNRVAGLTRLS